MARLRPLAPAEFSAEMRDFLGAAALEHPENLGVARIWAQRSDIYLAFRRFVQSIFGGSLLPRRLVEIIRLRVAFHNQCRSCMAIRYSAAVEDGVTEGLVCELKKPEDAPNLTEKERVALRYADLLATDHLSIDDKLFDDLRQHYSEPEIIEIGAHIAYCVGFGRLAMSWDMVDDLPERFKDRDREITPWGEGAVIV
jgi:AhpD family alkylhydroperoxidase